MSDNSIISVDISQLQQGRKFEGFGTSLCWWGNVIGRWEDRELVEKICALLFERLMDLGLIFCAIT